MANTKGRDFIIKRDATGGGSWQTVGGMRSNQLVINGETIDVSDKDGSEWRELLEGGIRSMSLSGSGVFDNSTQLNYIEDAAMDGTFEDIRIYDGSGNYFEGEFQVTNFTLTGEHSGALEFSCSFESSEEVTLTRV